MVKVDSKLYVLFHTRRILGWAKDLVFLKSCYTTLFLLDLIGFVPIFFYYSKSPIYKRVKWGRLDGPSLKAKCNPMFDEMFNALSSKSFAWIKQFDPIILSLNCHQSPLLFNADYLTTKADKVVYWNAISRRERLLRRTDLQQGLISKKLDLCRRRRRQS